MQELPERIVIATRNQGKVREIRDLVAELPIAFLSLDDLPPLPEVIEDGDTFEANALKKAREVAHATGIATLADDSGLCVDALDGRPGVLSARYGGKDSSDRDKCLRLLEEMKDIPESDRAARFVCVVALVWPEGEEHLFTGTCEGTIATEPRGESGFGYDPVFMHPETGISFAEMSRQEKNRVSHRGAALGLLSDYLRKLPLPQPSMT